MSWLMQQPELDLDEHVLWRTTANWEQDRRRQVGGILILTERRFLFTPGRFDASIGGHGWWAPRGAITGVAEQPRLRGFHLGAAAAGNRRRLRLSTAYGGHQLFTVNQVRRKVVELHTLLELAPT